MNQGNTLAGIIRYEFLMQVRRPALWIGMGLLALLLYAAGLNAVLDDPIRGKILTHHDDILYWSWSSLGVLLVGAGLLTADRFRRDQRTKVNEMLRVSPAPLASRLLGKYLGSTLATLVPIALIYFGGVVYMAARWNDFSVLPLSVATFALLGLPPVFFVCAFSIACTTVLWQPLYMFLFVGYWFWANLGSDVAIPTISGTYLSPGEGYVINGIFHFGRYQFVTPVNPGATAAQGIVNILVLLACAAVALFAAWRLLAWQAIHE
jgi:hypothetical protein